MEICINLEDSIPQRKRISATLELETLKKLEVAHEYLKKDNPTIKKCDVIETALNHYFEKLNIRECEIERSVPFIIKKKGYEVKR